MLSYGLLFGLMPLVFVMLRTNAFVELMAWIENKPVIWMMHDTRKPRKLVPWKLEKKGVLIKNKRRHSFDYYPLPRDCIYQAGPSKEAILFEGTGFPYNLNYMKIASKVKKRGFPDYTQFEIALCLQALEKDADMKLDNSFLYHPQELSQDGTQYKQYRRGIDWVQEQITAMTGNPWNCTEKEIKRALGNKYPNEQEDFNSLEEFRNWINKNASTHDIEDIITAVKIEAKQDAEFGKPLLDTSKLASLAVPIVVVLIGLGILWIMFNSGGGFAAMMPKMGGAIPGIPTTTQPEPPITL